MIRCVIFDIGDTLLRYDIVLVCKRLGRLAGKSEEHVKRVLYGDALDPDALVYRFDGGKIDEHVFIQELRLALGISDLVPDVRIADALITCFEFPRNFYALLHFLSDHYILGVISNINPLHWRHINESFSTISEHSGVFSFHTLSFREKVLKPDLSIFMIAFANAWRMYRIRHGGDLKVHECLFLDDREINVCSAEELGMKSILVEKGETSIMEGLREHGVFLPDKEYSPPLKKQSLLFPAL